MFDYSIVSLLPGGKGNKLYRWMVKHLQFNSDRDIGPTELAEEAAEEFDRLEYLDDPDHWIWDASCLAIDTVSHTRLQDNNCS